MDGTETRYYFDTNALFKYYRQENGSLAIRKVVANHLPIIVSPFTILEFHGIVMRNQRKKILNADQVNQIFITLRRDMSDKVNTPRYFLLLPMPNNIYRRAEKY